MWNKSLYGNMAKQRAGRPPRSIKRPEYRCNPPLFSFEIQGPPRMNPNPDVLIQAHLRHTKTTILTTFRFIYALVLGAAFHIGKLETPTHPPRAPAPVSTTYTLP